MSDHNNCYSCAPVKSQYRGDKNKLRPMVADRDIFIPLLSWQPSRLDTSLRFSLICKIVVRIQPGEEEKRKTQVETWSTLWCAVFLLYKSPRWYGFNSSILSALRDHLWYVITCDMGLPVIWDHLWYGITCYMELPVIWDYLWYKKSRDTFIEATFRAWKNQFEHVTA